MVSTTYCNDDDDKTELVSGREDIVSEDVEGAHASSRTQQEGSEQDIYDSDSGDSDCSVTSGLNGHFHERTSLFTEKQVGYSTADESGDTTWTDEKHSSYLDSMEATFVQKMYDKEYCSLDVCGHSSTSSLTLDQESVDSQPCWLNIRKPCEWKKAGLLTFRAPTRPMALTPMLTSPWIQHFKSRKNGPCQNPRAEGKSAEQLHTKKVQTNVSRVNLFNVLSGFSPPSGNGLTYRKRDLACASETAECKKQKSQLATLSHMDILMEQQFNKEQLRNIGNSEGNEDEDGQGEQKEHVEKCHKHRDADASLKNVASAENNLLKDEQKLTTSIDIKPTPLSLNGVLTQKPDQVVPSYKSMNGESSVKTSSTDLDGDDVDTFCAAVSEPDRASNRSESKTWTWSNEGATLSSIRMFHIAVASENQD